MRDFLKRALNICLNVKSQKEANSSVGKLLVEHPESKFLKRLLKLEGSERSDTSSADR